MRFSEAVKAAEDAARGLEFGLLGPARLNSDELHRAEVCRKSLGPFFGEEATGLRREVARTLFASALFTFIADHVEVIPD